MPSAILRLAHWSRPRALIALCLATGVAGEALFRDARLGLNFSLFVLLAASVHAAFAAVHGPTWRRVFAASLPAVVSTPVFLFDSQWARFFAIPSALAWLVLVPRFVEHGLDLRVFGRIPERTAEAVLRLIPALGRAMRLPAESVRHEDGRTDAADAEAASEATPLRTLTVGLAVGVPSALVFMALFSFDPKFSRALVALGRRSDDGLAFALSALGLALLVVLLVSIEDVRVPPIPATAPSPLGGVEPYRAPPRPESPASSRARWSLPSGAWSLVLLQVSAVFALYVALHATELFAGHAHVRTTRGLTYAGQLHAGFFALLLATALAIGLVVMGHALNERSPEAATPTRRGHSRLASELLLLTLTLPTLASCAQKLVLYVEAYGQTYLRLGVGVAIVLTFPLVVLTGIKCASGFRNFGSAATLLVLLVASGSAFFDADAHVARTNVERALRGAPFDAEYIGSLGSGALRGLAAGRPGDAIEKTQWMALVRGLVPVWSASHSSPLRAYRRETSCVDVLPSEVCAP